MQPKRPPSQTVFLTLSCPTFPSISGFPASAVVRPSATPSVLSFINRILTGDALSRDAPAVNMWYLNFFSVQILVSSSTFRTKGALIYERLFSGH